MIRFTVGSILGSIAGAVTAHYTTAGHGVLVGIGVALLIWFGIEILDELA